MSESDLSGPAPLGLDASKPLVLGPLSSITGIIQYAGTIVVEGRYEADIRCERLIVSASAVLDGVVVADRVEISGRAVGEVYAKEIVLRPTAHVEAELIFTSLVLDIGAYFEGRSRQHPHPKSSGPRFPSMRSERAVADRRPAEPVFQQAAE
ncbi:MAG: polymer-forming cytoskeletal protein [Hyphomicrobiaceae bacterium]